MVGVAPTHSTKPFQSGCPCELLVPDSSEEVIDGIKKHFEGIGVPKNHGGQVSY